MAAPAEHGTHCAVCRRNLLVGEAARTFQDPRSRGLQTVCPLCIPRATRQGWQPVGEREARRPLPVNGNNEVDHERLVRRLQMELERIEHDLGGRTAELHSERESRAALEQQVQALHDELAAARAEAAQHASALSERDTQIGDMRRRVAEEHDAQEMLLRARRREADAAYLCGIAVEVFNRSEATSVIEAETLEYGEPAVRVGVDGVRLPRAVRIVFGWPNGSRQYRVTCDLVARLFDVEDLSHGAGMQPAVAEFDANAHIVEGRLVLDKPRRQY